MAFLYELSKLLLFTSVLCIVAGAIYAIFKGFTSIRSKAFAPSKLILTITLVSVVAAPVLAAISPYLGRKASKEHYAEWTEKCGHRPIVAYNEAIGGMRRVSFEALDEEKSTDFYCTFIEAGEVPASISKQSLIDAGYTPSKEDLEFINEGRSPNERIRF